MRDIIRDNRRRTAFLIAAMTLLLALLGAAIGLALAPNATGLLLGAGLATALAGTQAAVALTAGDRAVLGAVGARPLSHADAPRLINVVEEIAIAAGMTTPPQVYVVDDAAPNAFAVGLHPDRAAVAVTTGLLKCLNRDQLQGVIAHEVGHIVNRDARLMTVAAVMVGSIALLADLFFRGMMHRGLSGRGGRRVRVNVPPQVLVLIIVAAILLAVIAPIAARLLYLATSRRREYLADATAAYLTRFPEGLAAALEIIATQAGASARLTNRAVAPLYIVNPLAWPGADKWTATHPPTRERIRILRGMVGGAAYADYARAAARVKGLSAGFLVGLRELGDGTAVPLRAATPADESAVDQVARVAEVSDVADRIAGYVVVPCPCGVHLKVPPELDTDTLTCPRCGRQHAVPGAIVAAAPTAKTARYRRQTSGWDNFRCACGTTLQLSPRFRAETVRCRKCGRVTWIDAADAP